MLNIDVRLELLSRGYQEEIDADSGEGDERPSLAAKS